MKNVVPDIILVLGLILLGYGLFLYSPRISYCAVGFLLIAYGLLLDILPHVPRKKEATGK